MKVVILNNSTAVYIAKLGLFKKVLKIASLVTTPEVKSEIEEGAKAGYKDARIRLTLISEGKIKVIKPKTTSKIEKSFGLKTNDASVIALAKEMQGILATEDYQVRNVARMLSIKTTNTISLIELLEKNKILKMEQIQELLELLDRFGYNQKTILNYRTKLL